MYLVSTAPSRDLAISASSNPNWRKLVSQDSGKWRSLNKSTIPRQTDLPTEMRGSRHLTCWDAWKKPGADQVPQCGKNISCSECIVYPGFTFLSFPFSSAILETYINNTQTQKTPNRGTKKMSQPWQTCFKLNTKNFIKWYQSHENYDSLKDSKCLQH